MTRAAALPTHYVYSRGGPIAIHGGIASNDGNGGSNPDWWFNASGTYLGGGMNVYGLSLVNGGQTNTSIFQFNGTDGGMLSGNNGIPLSQITNLFGGNAVQQVTDLMTTPGVVRSISGFQGGISQAATTSFANIGSAASSSIYVLTDGTTGATCIAITNY